MITEEKNLLVDNYGRVHDYLRISLTDKCNLRCSYCIPYDLPAGYYANSIRMKPAEIQDIVKEFVNLGIKKIRLTGGEPFVRKEIREILLALSVFPVELGVTTNGILVNQFFETLIQAKVKSINLSLDTLKPAKYLSITRRDDFSKVMFNIHLLIANNFFLKLNTVVMKDVNDDEILDFVELTKNLSIQIRFIEFMPFNGNQWNNSSVFTHSEILNRISSRYSFVKLDDGKNSTSKNYRVDGFKGSFGIISSMSEPFCEECNRIRLTSDGKLKNCLFSKTETDLLTPLRKGNEIRSLILETVKAKFEKQGGQLHPDLSSLNPVHIRNRSMVAIGG